ncbi:serine/threonine-protein phosphatase 4 regulatory subunit 2 isoform X1 [Lampetra planeri]
MEPEALLEAIAEFEKKPNKEVTPELDGFMRHVAKTGETMLPWTQLKGYFMYKLERVLDDFRASVPEVRGPPNRNVDYVPYDDMKERLLKIVDGFTSAPFTIQRLCELLMEPKKHYKRTDKFMRGIEKNVLVVSSVYPSSEKFNFSTSTLNRVNGILPSGPNTAYQDRSNVNGPGTPRPPIRSRSPSPGSCPLLPSSNGFGDGTVHHATDEERASQSSPPPSESNPLKTKHGAQDHLEEGTSDDPQAKRLRFDEEDEEEEEDEDQQSADEEEEEEAEERGARGSSARSPEATSGNARSPHGFEQRPVSDITEEQSCSASADTGATEHCSVVESVPSSVGSEPKVTGEEQEDEEEEEPVHDMDQSDCGGGVGGPEAADSEAGAVTAAAAAATEAAVGSGGEAAVSSSGLAGGADSNSSDGSGCGGSSSVSSSAEPSEDTEQPMDQD